MKLIQTYAIFGSFWVNLEIHKSKPLDSNLEPTNPPLKDLNLTNPMASLGAILNYQKTGSILLRIGADPKKI